MSTSPHSALLHRWRSLIACVVLAGVLLAGAWLAGWRESVLSLLILAGCLALHWHGHGRHGHGDGGGNAAGTRRGPHG